MNYEITRVVITKERKHDNVEKALTVFNTMEEIEELKSYISDIWNKEVKKVSPEDQIVVTLTIWDKTKRELTTMNNETPILNEATK